MTLCFLWKTFPQMSKFHLVISSLILDRLRVTSSLPEFSRALDTVASKDGSLSHMGANRNGLGPKVVNGFLRRKRSGPCHRLYAASATLWDWSISKSTPHWPNTYLVALELCLLVFYLSR